MKCVEVEHQLNLLADDEIDFSQKEEIERHLQNCPSCQNSRKSLQFVGAFLKQPVSAPANLDERVLDAFQKHHANKKPLPILKEKRRFFGRIFIPVPIFALVLAVFALAVGTAYQFGKISAATTITADKKDSEILPDKSSDTANLSPQTSVKYIEVPVTKIVKIPVIKEKPITRIIYRDKNAKKTFSPINPKTPEIEADKNNQYLTEFDLRGFQVVSELKPRIIKEGKNQ